MATLYLPWGAFLVFLVRQVGSGAVRFSLAKGLAILIPCAIVMSPQTYVIFFGRISFAGQIKALTMLFLLVAVARIDMPSALFGDSTVPERDLLS